jgi:hypothetical protein
VIGLAVCRFLTPACYRARSWFPVAAANTDADSKQCGIESWNTDTHHKHLTIAGVASPQNRSDPDQNYC